MVLHWGQSFLAPCKQQMRCTASESEGGVPRPPPACPASPLSCSRPWHEAAGQAGALQRAETQSQGASPNSAPLSPLAAREICSFLFPLLTCSPQWASSGHWTGRRWTQLDQVNFSAGMTELVHGGLGPSLSGKHNGALPRPSCKSLRAAGMKEPPVLFPQLTQILQRWVCSIKVSWKQQTDVSWGGVMGGRQEHYMK